MFKTLPHTADFKVKFSGKDLKDLIHSVFDFYRNFIIYSNCDEGSLKNEKISIEDESFEFIVVRLINELIFLKETGRMIKDYKIERVSENRLDLSIKTIDCEEISFSEGFKSATYHNLKLKRDSEGNFVLTVVIDT